MANNDVVLNFKVGNYYIGSVEWVNDAKEAKNIQLCFTKYVDNAAALVVGYTQDGEFTPCDYMDTFFDSEIAKSALLLGAGFVKDGQPIKPTAPTMPAALAFDNGMNIDRILSDNRVQTVYFKVGHYYVDAFLTDKDCDDRDNLKVTFTLDENIAKRDFSFKMALPNNKILKQRMLQAITPKELLDIGAHAVTSYVVTDED